MVEPFNSSYAPGPKDFDFDVNQISITPKRAEQVDFSLALLRGRAGGGRAQGLRARRARPRSPTSPTPTIGVQIGTTSLDAVNEVIQPSAEPQVFDTSNDVVTALKNGPGRRGRRRRADRLLPDRGPGARRRRSSASSRPPAATSGGRCWRRTRRSPPASRRRSTSSNDSGELPAIEKQWMSDVDRARRCSSSRATARRERSADRRAERAAARRAQHRARAGDRGGLDGRRARRARGADPDQPGLARGPRHVLRRGGVHATRSPTSSRPSGSTSGSSCVVEVVRPGPRPRRRAGAHGRTAPALFPLRLLAIVYTDVFRGIPTILLVYLVGFGIPALRRSSGLPTEPVVLGGIALTLSYGAYVAEVYRAGLQLGPPRPARRGARGRAHRAPGAAPRDPAAGGAPRRPAAAQRLHRAAEGRRPDRDPRRHRRGVPRRRRSRPPPTSTTRR